MKQPAVIDETTHLAFERTRIAQERTLLAWIRTATSLIAFGFTIFSVFAIESGAGHRFAGFWGPRVFSACLIVVGLISLTLAAGQHREDQAVLRSIDSSLKAGSNAMILAWLIAGLGILALIMLLARNLWLGSQI